MKKAIPLVQFTATFITVSLALLLSGCGGGGDDSPTRVGELSYPECGLGGSGLDGVAGCWVSEVCGSGGETESTWGVEGVRYLAQISEDQVSPVAGFIDQYYLLYNNDQCAGNPSVVIDKKKELREQGFEWIIRYETFGFETCTDKADITGNPALISCTALDISSIFRPLGSTSGVGSMAFGAYDGAIVNDRLCMSGGIYTGYNPDNADDFGIGGTGFSGRGTELDYLNCLTRFTRP